MQIKSLEFFVAVVQFQSFSAAANALHTVQSNVTSHIKKLEQELGTELLHRQSPILPTRAGLQLLHYAEKILQLHQNTLQHFCHSKVDVALPLEIGSMETTAAIRLPKLFRDVQHSRLQLPYTLRTGSSRELIQLIRGGKLDCAFIANSSPIDGLFNFHVWTEELVLISAQQASTELTNSDLSHKKFISFKQGCSYRKVIDQFLSSRDLPATNILEMGSLDGIMSCVSLDVGVAILPLKYVQQSHFYTEVQVHQLDTSLQFMNTYLIAHEQTQWCSNMHQFFKMLQPEI